MEENNTVNESPVISNSQDIQYLPEGEVKENKAGMIIAVIVGIIIMGLLIWGAVALIMGDAEVTGKVRDVFIIFFALESIVIGAALVILIIQVAVLTNLLQNEIKPILDSTNDTVNTLRGTVRFLSDNLAEPVIKMNEYLAAIQKFIDIVRPKNR